MGGFVFSILLSLVACHNEIIEEIETDPSLKIEIKS